MTFSNSKQSHVQISELKGLAMIEFVVSFLVGFVFPKFEIELKTKQGKSKDKFKDKKKKNVSPPVIAAVVEEKLDPNVIKCGTRKEVCHVEYTLLPVEAFPVFQIDIVCWGEVTKIFTNEDVCCVKSYTEKNITWVSFTILHKLQSVTDQILKDLLNFEASFTFGQLPNELMPHVKKDVPKEFYDKQDEFTDNEITKRIFKSVLQTTPAVNGNTDETVTKEKYQLSYPERDTVVSLLCCVPLDIHEKGVITKINDFKNNLLSTETEKSSAVMLATGTIKKSTLKGNDSNSTMKGSVKRKEKLKKEKSLKKKGKTPTTASKNKFTLNLVGVLFFKEGQVLSCEMREPQSSSLAYTGVFVTVNNLLTYRQKKSLNPFTLDIRQLCNLPQYIVDKYRISQIYCEFVLNNLISEKQTPKIDLTSAKEADFNYSHVFFLYPINEQSSYSEVVTAFLQVEALQTGRLVIKVYGLTTTPAEESVIPCVFGQRRTDPYISSCQHELFTKRNKPNYLQKGGVVLLGTAVVNLFPLSCGDKHFQDIITLTSLPVSVGDVASDTATPSIDKINHTEYKLQDQTLVGIIPEYVLLRECTALKVEVSLAKPVYQLSLNHQLLLPSVYSRVIVVFKNMKAAISVVKKIQALNSEVLGSKSVLFPLFMPDTEKRKYYEMCKGQSSNNDFSLMNFEARKMSLMSNLGLSFTSGESLSYSIISMKKNMHVITGFYVDNFQEGILVVEGLTNITFPRIFAFIYTLPVAFGHVVYNSDILFSKKMYSDLSNLGGLYIVTLGKSMDSLLREPSMFLEGNIPKPAQKTLQQLDMLRRTLTMQSACKMELFPTSQQLLSLGVEFGVPLRMPSQLLYTRLSSKY